MSSFLRKYKKENQLIKKLSSLDSRSRNFYSAQNLSIKLIKQQTSLTSGLRTLESVLENDFWTTASAPPLPLPINFDHFFNNFKQNYYIFRVRLG